MNASDPIRVMVVDDSAVVRGLITRMLEEDHAISVIASVSNGQMALSALERHDIEVVILDIEMPVMDGLTALPLLLKFDPHIQVIMASTLTLKNADISLRAMNAGAADYIPKPTTSREISGGTQFKHDLLEKVRALGSVRRRYPPKQGGSRPGPSHQTAHSPTVGGATSAASAATARLSAALSGTKIGSSALRVAPPFVLRQGAPEIPDVIAIGSSTGGPQALFAVLTPLKAANLRQPILITQHMPPTFTTILAEHITRVTGLIAAEGQDGESVQAGRVYVAPGDFHMIVEARGTDKIIRLNKNPPENFCRPSVDPMLRSMAAVWGRRILGIILTGMGSDGAKGGQAIVEAGGAMIAQDEASSVVWGMPGAAANAGICSAVLPLRDIPSFVLRLASRQ